ncbi:MAG: hypothetical protein AB7G44_00280 [Bacteroidia bacterium]
MIETISTILIAASLLIGSGSTEDKSSSESSQPSSGQIITNDETGM